MAQTKQRGEFQKFLAKIRAEAIIEWKNPELKKIYDARIASDATEAVKGELSCSRHVGSRQSGQSRPVSRCPRLTCSTQVSD